MLNMQRMEIFIAVMEAGSFTGAAETLGLTKAVVSINIKRLEQELGVSLLTRSTRKVSATDAGERFYQRCLKLSQDAEMLLEDVRSEHGGLRGILRITTTPEYGAKFVVPALATFSALHQNLKIYHSSSSNNNDLISGRLDVAIRLGQLDDSTHHAKLLDSFEIIPVASVGYLQEHHAGAITDLAQLQCARWIAHGRLAKPLSWEVVLPNGHVVLCKANMESTITADTVGSLLAFTRSGAGIALLPNWLVQEDIASGQLIQLLSDHRFPKQGIYAVYPNTRHVTEKVRKFIDFLQNDIDEKKTSIFC